MGVVSALKGLAKSSVRATDDIRSGAADVVSTGVRKGTSPLSIAAVGGAGAYSYGQFSDLQEEGERTERYSIYQQRLSEIETAYTNGEISKARMDELKGQARQDYYSSNDDDGSNRGLSFTEFLAQLGTIQLMTLAALASAGLYFVGRPLAQAVNEKDISLESILG